MHIDRELLDRLRKDPAVKWGVSEGHADTKTEISKMGSALDDHLKKSQVEKASNWMLYKDLWLRNESGHLKRNTTYRNYTRGSIIMSLEWGTGNIGSEIRYPHPGVVLYDQGEDWIIVAPITSAKIDRETQNPVAHPPFEVLAWRENSRPKDPHEYWFQKHSVIQVDQMQRLSKYRALNKKSYKIKEHLMNQIDNIIFEYYLPGKHQLMEELKDLLIRKNKELDRAKREIKRLQAEIDKKNE